MITNIAEILDRWSICKLKVERIGKSAEPEFLELDAELKIAEKKYPNLDWKAIEKYIYDCNDFIWQCEAGMKSGKEKLTNPNYVFDRENYDALVRLGTATVIIRNFNHLRVNFKNFINKLVGEGFSDIKKNHLSE